MDNQELLNKLKETLKEAKAINRKRQREHIKELKQAIDVELSARPGDKPMLILKSKIDIDETLQQIMDAVSDSIENDEKLDKIINFFMEIDALTRQFMDYIGVERIDD